MERWRRIATPDKWEVPFHSKGGITYNLIFTEGNYDEEFIGRLADKLQSDPFVKELVARMYLGKDEFP